MLQDYLPRIFGAKNKKSDSLQNVFYINYIVQFLKMNIFVSPSLKVTK